jgi:glutamate synthase domain-containing protein 1
VGAFFLPREPDALAAAVRLVEAVFAGDGIPFLGWREVPVNPVALGPTALASCPTIRQALVGRPALAGDEEAWERALYLARREIERRAAEQELPGFYVCSLSCRTVVYKALLTGTQLPAFFTDFRYPEYESAIAVFHQRYSTNTLPSWPLAQPFRLVAHNGEINTLWGNRNAMTDAAADAGLAGVGRGDRRGCARSSGRKGATRPASTTPWSCWCGRAGTRYTPP